MATLGGVTLAGLKALQDKIREDISKAGSFEEASQHYANALFDEFKESIVLIRLFATMPYGQLPKENRSFVDKLGASKGVRQSIHDHTLVLSLLGTSGGRPEWKDRRKLKAI